MILPILALSFGGIASIARTLRAELAEVLTMDFIASGEGPKALPTVRRLPPCPSKFLCAVSKHFLIFVPWRIVQFPGYRADLRRTWSQ